MSTRARGQARYLIWIKPLRPSADIVTAPPQGTHMKPQSGIALLKRVIGSLVGLLLFAAAGAYAASTVEVYKDPG